MKTEQNYKQLYDNLLKDFNKLLEIANYPKRCKFCNEYCNPLFVCNNCWQDTSNPEEIVLNEKLKYHLPVPMDLTLITEKDVEQAISIIKEKRIPLVKSLCEVYENKYKNEI